MITCTAFGCGAGFFASTGSLGLTEEQIAHNMGIAYSTLKYWKNDHLAILAALKRA